ncbi:MAG: hypothetical protein HOQ44_05665, partial [Nocardia sp.]|nr:hypothetical protein [Nocardia sp.]
AGAAVALLGCAVAVGVTMRTPDPVHADPFPDRVAGAQRDRGPSRR